MELYLLRLDPTIDLYACGNCLRVRHQKQKYDLGWKIFVITNIEILDCLRSRTLSRTYTSDFGVLENGGCNNRLWKAIEM